MAFALPQDVAQCFVVGADDTALQKPLWQIHLEPRYVAL
jgi:hypothetical protein